MDITAKYLSLPQFMDKLRRDGDADVLKLLERKRLL